jgi:hypothetical protein
MHTALADCPQKSMYLDTVAEYDLYCLYAGDLVTEGMSLVGRRIL